MIQAVTNQVPTFTEVRETMNSCKETLVNFKKTHYEQACTETNRKIVRMNAFVSFSASVIFGSTVPVAVSAAALSVIASAVYVAAIPLFKALFADDQGNISKLAHTFCGITSAALTLSLAPEQGLVYLLPIINLLYAMVQKEVNVHQMPKIFLF